MFYTANEEDIRMLQDPVDTLEEAKRQALDYSRTFSGKYAVLQCLGWAETKESEWKQTELPYNTIPARGLIDLPDEVDLK